MFLVIKKRLLIIIAILLIAVAVSLSGTFVINAFSATPQTVVVLDAGHGGKDGGAKGINSGATEAEINLIIVKKIEKLLKAQGIGVVLTRKDDNSLYTESVSKKQKDMELRKKVILETRPDLVVSVHCNKFPDSARRGAQAFFDPFNSNGKALAVHIQTNLNTINSEYARRSFDSLKGDYYILNCSHYPSAIVECGFLSNAEDDALLNKDEYRDMLAYRIFCGIVGYLSCNE